MMMFCIVTDSRHQTVSMKMKLKTIIVILCWRVELKNLTTSELHTKNIFQDFVTGNSHILDLLCANKFCSSIFVSKIENYIIGPVKKFLHLSFPIA